jgi:toxin-antitoxin system PIN domain toxin
MILADVNVLVYAFREDSADHPTYKAWLEDIVNGDQAYGMSHQVLAGLIRVATHPKIFARPSRMSEVLAFASALLDQPNCQIVEPGPRHWDIFTRLCGSANAIGNLVPDAWFAALAIESGCEWITNDRDYSRFAGLQWRTVLTDEQLPR